MRPSIIFNDVTPKQAIENPSQSSGELNSTREELKFAMCNAPSMPNVRRGTSASEAMVVSSLSIFMRQKKAPLMRVAPKTTANRQPSIVEGANGPDATQSDRMRYMQATPP